LAQTASNRYAQFEADRAAYVERAREASKLTIPALVPPVGTSSGSRLPTPYQSTGARGVNNLASKLLLTLFPPNQPFFRFEIGDMEVAKYVNGDPAKKSAFQAALSSIEREVQAEVEQQAIRVPAFEALKHLIVSGNVLLYMLPKGGMRVFHLLHYVVRRDPDGNVLEIIAKECISPEMLPEDFEKRAGLDGGADGGGDLESNTVATDGGGSNKEDDGTSNSTDKTVDLYTWIRRVENKRWTVHQEALGSIIPGSEGTYPLDNTPWLPLRWARVDGEDYGRGFVEEYQGDLQSLEGLSQAIVEAAAQAAKVLWLVKPNGTTKMKAVANSPNGAVREGSREDVSVLQMDKQADMAIASQTADTLKKDLAFAFLLNSAIQRDAERVTSSEIRYMAQELETSLGGLYSILTQEFQLPLVRRLLLQMQKAKKIPALPKTLRPTIVTGLEALGRGNDLDKLNQFMTEIVQLGPQVVAQYLNVSDYLTRVATSVGIDTTGLIKPDAQVQQEAAQAQQQAMQQQAVQSAVPHLAKAAADGMKDITVGKVLGPSQGGAAQGPPATGTTDDSGTS